MSWRPSLAQVHGVQRPEAPAGRPPQVTDGPKHRAPPARLCVSLQETGKGRLTTSVSLTSQKLPSCPPVQIHTPTGGVGALLPTPTPSPTPMPTAEHDPTGGRPGEQTGRQGVPSSQALPVWNPAGRHSKELSCERRIQVVLCPLECGSSPPSPGAPPGKQAHAHLV